MKLIKLSGKKCAFILIVVLIGTIGFYLGYLTPKKRAAHHLDFVHQAIKDLHPAILETDAGAFHQWHKDGYEEAKKLLSQVKTEADENALLHFYLAGYKDSHLSGHLDHTPFSKIDAERHQWTGWLLKATNNGYTVIHRKEGEMYPPENARLISCDGQAIDELLRKHYAPYIDNRWHILKARDLAAKTFTQKNSFTSILNRPEFNTCDFQINGTIQTFPHKWLFTNKAQYNEINEHSYGKYQLPSLTEIAPGTIWIRARDFGLYTPEAAYSQKKMLADIVEAKDRSLIIIDTRGNGGGDSTHGNNILNAVFDQDEKAQSYLSNQYQYATRGSNALFRASWRYYWAYEHRLKKVIATQGKDSTPAKYGERFLARLKKTLDAADQTLYQFENVSLTTDISEPVDNWESKIHLVLITDKYCTSACLDFVDILKLVPNLLHLGEPTNADTVYTEIAHAQSEYFKETFNFIVPVKKWNKRLREDNLPYTPDVIYDGDMNNDEALKQWVLNHAKQHFSVKEDKNYAQH